MKPALILIAVVLLLVAGIQTAQANGTPQPGDPPNRVQLTTADRTSGFPWLGILVLVIAGVVYMYVTNVSSPANIVTGNCCAPVIDEDKMERERKKIAEEENS